MSTTYKNIIKQQIYDFKIVKDIFCPIHKSNFICFFTLAMKKCRKIKQFLKIKRNYYLYIQIKNLY